MDTMIETIASGLGNSVGWMADKGVLFAIFAIAWVGFGAALLRSQGSIDAAWQAIRALPLVVQAVVWLLLLPVMVGAWIWESTWPVIVRLVLIGGIAWWNLLILSPRALQASRP
jgi:hypothetical protein